MRPRCPYCSKQLEKTPTRKAKCPHCSQYIFVRGGKLVTEQQVWITKLEGYGASSKMYADVRKGLSKQYGFEAPPRDAIWGMMNQLVTRQKAFHQLESLYLLMGQFVKEEEKDPTPYIRLAMEMKEAGIKQRVHEAKKNVPFVYEDESEIEIQVRTANDPDVCGACRKAADRTYTPDEYLKDMPIPAKCENPDGCRCGIVVGFRSRKGRRKR